MPTFDSYWAVLNEKNPSLLNLMTKKIQMDVAEFRRCLERAYDHGYKECNLLNDTLAKQSIRDSMQQLPRPRSLFGSIFGGD